MKAQRGQTSSAEWLIPAALIILSTVPVVAGSFRLLELGRGAAITPENARFFAAPLPVTLHIVSVTVYSLLGAFQFVPGLRKRHPAWHRAAGRVLIPSGFIAALSGLWMSQFYPLPAYDGTILYGLRLFFGSAMVFALVLGVDALRRREFTQHGAWMLRAYAIALGAGTQFFTHIPLLIFPSLYGELTRALCMGAGWAINLAVAEWLIRRRNFRPKQAAMT